MTRQLLCEVRGKLNKHPSTPPNSSKWKKTSSAALPSSSKETHHTRIPPHSSSKRFSQPISPSYEFDNILADKPVNDLSNISSRTEINNSKILQTSDIFHFTDFVTTGLYHDFSTYSSDSFRLDGEYWKTVQHYYQAQKFGDVGEMERVSLLCILFLLCIYTNLF